MKFNDYYYVCVSEKRIYHTLPKFVSNQDKEQMFDGHSYNKGGRILHMLRNYIGDEAFFKGISNYLNANKFKAAEFHQLRLAFEEVSGEDLNWFFNQWYLGSGHPILEVNQQIDAASNTVTVSVKQNQSLELSPIFKLPLEIAVFDSNGKHVHKVVVDKLNQTFMLPYSGTLNNVVFDNQQMLLAKISETKPTEQYIFQFYNGQRYRARKEGLINGSKSKDQKGQQLILDALNDPFWNIRLIAIEKAAKLNVDNKDKGISLIKDLALNDPKSQVRSAALNFLSNNLGADAITEVYIDRIEKDQSYLVISNALKNLGKANPTIALAKAKGLENEKSSKMISGVAQLYGSYGEKENYEFFNTVLKGTILQGFDQLSVMNSLTYFITRQEPEMMDQSFELYSHLNAEGGYYTKMFIPQNINYLLSMFDSKIEELETEIALHEKNKDAVYADRARKKQKLFKAMKVKFEILAVKGEE